MYALLLFSHSWLRYLVLGLGLWLLLVALRRRSDGSWGSAQERAHTLFLAALDTQFLIGLILLFVSPLPAAALADLALAMKNAVLRFFAVEHPLTMFIALSVAHIGRVRAKRRPLGQRASTVLWTQLIWLVLTLVSIPWPGLDIARPLFRGF